VGQESLGGGCRHVRDMGVGWGVWSWIIVGADRVKRGKGPKCALFKGIGKV
jgi:hypothetical protein